MSTPGGLCNSVSTKEQSALARFVQAPGQPSCHFRGERARCRGSQRSVAHVDQSGTPRREVNAIPAVPTRSGADVDYFVGVQLVTGGELVFNVILICCLRPLNVSSIVI